MYRNKQTIEILNDSVQNYAGNEDDEDEEMADEEDEEDAELDE